MYDYHNAIVMISGRAHYFYFFIYILCSSWFCEIWALRVLWITYGHLLYAPFLAYWAFFGSLVPAMFNRTSYDQVHESTLFPWLHIYIYIYRVFHKGLHNGGGQDSKLSLPPLGGTAYTVGGHLWHGQGHQKFTNM